jgi:uncharacterized membrane protein
MRAFTLIAAAACLSACDARTDSPANTSVPAVTANGSAPASNEAAPGPPPAKKDPAAARWDLQSSGEGVALVLLSASGGTTLRLYCPAGGKRLLVNVPAFRPIGSEERLSFGGGGEVVALVADTRGDRQRGGVTGTGAVPAGLAGLLEGPVSASYGAQSSGPSSPPPSELARAFVAACGGGPASAPRELAPAPTPAAAACLTQGTERLRVRPLRAVGTEPFWGARIEGRCVTYSHPEDQKGTRVWTRYTAAPGGGGTWAGALGGRRFELRARAAPGCSDGMSDRRYPLAVELMVGGERRQGCAEPL